MQQFSAVTWSLKRYQQLSYPLLYAVIQTDTKKLLIRRKDSTNRGQKQPRVRGCFAEVPSVFCKDSTNRSQKQPRLRGCFAEMRSVCADGADKPGTAADAGRDRWPVTAAERAALRCGVARRGGAGRRASALCRAQLVRDAGRKICRRRGRYKPQGAGTHFGWEPYFVRS